LSIFISSMLTAAIPEMTPQKIYSLTRQNFDLDFYTAQAKL